MTQEAILSTDQAADGSKGLFGKYTVERIDGKPIKGGMAIVLEVGDFKVWPALAALADSVEHEGNRKFAADLRKLLAEVRAASDLAGAAVGRPGDTWETFLDRVVQSVKDPPSGLGWGKLELLGHRVLFGFLDEIELAGTKLLRIQTPDEHMQLIDTGRYAAGALYGFTPLPKQSVLASVGWIQERLWDLKHRKAAQPALPSGQGDHWSDDEDSQTDEDAAQDSPL